MARTVAAVRAVVLVQLRYATGLTSEQYIATRGWEAASLPSCPRHPDEDCGYARHGTYSRTPAGAKVPRWYCPDGHTTFSLLPDCLPARFGGTLPELEQVVAQAEQVGVEAAADILRPDNHPAAVTSISAIRWVRRRVRLVHAALSALLGLIPELFANPEPTVSSVRTRLNVLPVLGLVREISAAYLHVLPPPLGFGPRPQRRWITPRRRQHSTGTDPP